MAGFVGFGVPRIWRGGVGILLLAGVCGAAATAPATRPASPKLAAAAFLRSILSVDEKGAMEQLVFSDEQVRRDAAVMLHQVIAIGRLRRAVVQQFDARGQDSTVGAKEERDASDMLALLSAGKVRYDGNNAEITLDTGATLWMVLKGNDWKIDYDKSQRALGGLPTKREVEAAAKTAAALELLAGEVAGKLFRSPQEIESRYNAIRTAAMAATTSAPAK